MSDMDPLFPPTPAAGRAAESRTHRRSLRETPVRCAVRARHRAGNRRWRSAQGRHDCPLHQGPERGQAAYHLELHELSRTSKAYAHDARQPAAKGGHRVTRFGMWRIPDGSARTAAAVGRVAPDVGPRWSVPGSRDAQLRRSHIPSDTSTSQRNHKTPSWPGGSDCDLDRLVALCPRAIPKRMPPYAGGPASHHPPRRRALPAASRVAKRANVGASPVGQEIAEREPAAAPGRKHTVSNKYGHGQSEDHRAAAWRENRGSRRPT